MYTIGSGYSLMLNRASLHALAACLVSACAAAQSATPAPLPTHTAIPATPTTAVSPTPAVSATPLIGYSPATPTAGPTYDPSLVPSPTASPAPLITAAAPLEDTVERSTVFERVFNVPSSAYKSPWDDATLTVTFAAPSGAQVVVGGFYYGQNTWKVRFVPAEVGRYTWKSEFADAFGTLADAGELSVVESKEQGFVRIYEPNRFRWVFDDGTPYYPIGLQDCTDDRDKNGNPFDDFGFDGGFRAGPADLGTKVDINRYLDAYSAAGFNLWRWTAENCGFKLWKEIDPEGNKYLTREARLGDQLVRTLRAKGFRIYADIFAFEPPFPQDSNDGPKMYAVIRYVRYFVNRYAAYVDFWEVMNEATASDDWYNLVVNTVRQADPYDHPIATNWERPDLILIDINSPHWFETEDESISDIAAADRIRQARRFGKPIIFSEQGNADVNWDERSATRMRLRAWTAFFEEAALIFWNWSAGKDYSADQASNIYLGPEERGYVRALQAFTSGFDPAAEPVDIRTSAAERVRGYGLRSPTSYAAYLVNFTDHYSPTSGVNLTADVPAAGTATWYDPASGKTVATLFVAAGRRTLNVPDFVTDIALKITGG